MALAPTHYPSVVCTSVPGDETRGVENSEAQHTQALKMRRPVGNGRELPLWVPGVDASGKSFCNNKVVTSRYTVWNFLPKNFMEQFMKPANCYFAMLAVLQAIPETSTTGGVPTVAVPLLTILTLNAIKDAVEDYRRHKSDRQENERTVLVAQPAPLGAASGPSAAWELPKISNSAVSTAGSSSERIEAQPLSHYVKTSRWYEVQVGNVVVVRKEEYAPADMVLLGSSQAQGHVYVETANLDGETNLKVKEAPDALVRHDQKEPTEDLEEGVRYLQRLSGQIDCEGPNEFLCNFVGTLRVNGPRPDSEEERVPLNESNIVLRGSKVKNVEWAVGVVVYSGKQTKIMMNSKEKKGRKLSHLEKDMSKFTALIVLLQVVLCSIVAAASAYCDTSEHMINRTYLNLTNQSGSANSPFFILVVRFFNFMILFANFIPISLLVSVAFVKLIQAFFMYSDAAMVHNEICCTPRTSDLNEELGQVEYVFSDKTGTLTCNVMDFRKFCVAGITYGEGMTEIKKNVMMKMGLPIREAPPHSPEERSTPHVNLYDKGLWEVLGQKKGPEYRAVRSFLLHLAINHEVVPSTGGGLDGGRAGSYSMSYSASSPDEAALCYGALHFGFALIRRTVQELTIRLDNGEMLRVSVLAILRFTSARKRSSVLVRLESPDEDEDGTTGKVRTLLFTKGADSVVLPRLSSRSRASADMQRSIESLKDMAQDGLRTLCLAVRDVPKSEVDRWLEKFHDASCATEDRQERLEEVADEIERDLELQGITGIEDRLQDEVSTTITKLRQAGMKIWMLTGDKTETAINIGVATGLLETEETSKEGLRRPIFTTSDFEVDGIFQPQDFVRKLKFVAELAQEMRPKGKMFEGCVFDGTCLEVALSPEHEKELVAVCRICTTVVCCRVSPKQKGAVVQLIKREEKAVTLAIGDGANDCNMLQSADVGIGIRGLEGLQAFNVCDYGISQFRFLQHLLLVHGRWNYRRVAILINYTFYKNIVVVLPQYFLGFVSGFSGQKLYNDFLYQSYNLVHSMLPIVIFGVLDQDVSKAVSLQVPELYWAGRKGEYLNRHVSGGWLLKGALHAVIVFFLPYLTMSDGNITHFDGKANDIWLVGTVVYFLVIAVVNCEALLETCFISWLTVFGVSFSFFFWFIEQAYCSGALTGSVVTSELHGSMERMLSSPCVVIVLFCSILFSVVPSMQVRAVQRFVSPTILQRVQETVLRNKRAVGKE